MRKSLSSLFIFILLSFLLWGGVSWYLGEKTQQSLKTYLENHSSIKNEGLLSIELLDYKKTLLGAKAVLLLGFNQAILSEKFGNIELYAEGFNGPFFINKSGVTLGSSYWTVAIDKNSFDYSDYFKTPPKFEIRMDFEEKVHYLSKAQLSTDTLSAELLLTGLFDLEVEDNRGAITLQNVLYKLPQLTIKAEDVLISYQHQKRLTRNYKPGTSSIKIPSLSVILKQEHSILGKEPLALSLKSNSNISVNNDELFGYIGAKIVKKSSNQIPMTQANMSFHFKGVPSDAFVTFSEIDAEIENIKEQTQWALEESGELPEGQDQIWQLYDRLEELTQKRNTLFSSIFEGKESQINMSMEIKSPQGLSVATGLIKPLKNKLFEKQSLLSQFYGEADVELKTDLFNYLSTQIENQYYLKKKSFTLQLKDNKLLMYQ